MTSTQVERPVKVDNAGVKPVSQGSKEPERPFQRRFTFNSGAPAPKKNKHESDARFKFTRKRAQSFATGTGKFFPPYKRRKKEGIIPPTKFLLGGNIYDPLNLNSLQDEEINRAMNAVTPKSSPLPTPKHRKGEVEVIIPPNINDPLNLIDCEDDAKYEEQLVSPIKKGRKARNRKKKRNSSSGGSAKDDNVEGTATEDVSTPLLDEKKDDVEKVIVSETVSTSNSENPEVKVIRDLGLVLESTLKDKEKKGRKSIEDCVKDLKHEKRNRKLDLKDKIVSPVIPQPGTWKRQQHGHSSAPVGRYNRFRPGGPRQQKEGQPQQTPKFQAKNARFQYGNYLRYYGYRNPAHDVDPRLKCFSERSDLFYDKDVLDIGCNIGHITLSLARDFDARSVVGLDIDRHLIDIARKNVRHYVNCTVSPPNENGGPSSRFFPISMPILFGDVDIRCITMGESPSVRKKFPHNVTFVQGNYVLEADVLVPTEQPQFDVILCLSLTKWLHLNWGDAGLKRAFRRMYAQLRPGGKLILEAQAWESYKRKKNLTETIFRNYNSIEFLPHKFTQYLLSSEVGFGKCEVIGTSYHQSKGFQRPIQMFTKGKISSSRTNTPSYTCTTAPPTRATSQGPVYTPVLDSVREVEEDSTATPDQVEPSAPSRTEGEAVLESAADNLQASLAHTSLDANKETKDGTDSSANMDTNS